MWSNNQTTSDLNGLVAGNYSVTMTDSVGCTVAHAAIITSPSPLLLSNANTDATCHGFSNGTITITASGGVSPYVFGWNDGTTNQNHSNLGAGTYSVTVTDNNLCTSSLSTTIGQPTALTTTILSSNILCFSASDGSIQLSATGGTLGYTYLWNDGSTLQNRTNLPGGTYTVTVTDQHQCTASAVAVLTQPAAINIASQVTQPTCPQNGSDGSISVMVTGGNSTYHYAWSNGNTGLSATSLSPGNYAVTVSDGNGCSATESFTLAYLYNYSISTGPSVTIDLGQSVDLNYTVNGNAGTIVSNVWTPEGTLTCSDCINPTAAPNITTTYQITVENQLGCPATDTVTIYVTPDYDLYIPNAFTPNGDGNNDYFQVYGNLKGLEYFEVQIFNRWGEKVFDSHDIYFRWDGVYKGVLQLPQVFVYQIKVGFLDGHVDPLKKGSVTLIR